MQELRHSTTAVVKIGVVVNSTGVTPVTTLTIDAADEAEILKWGTTATLAISGTLTAITGCDGWYNMTLSTGDTSALGPLTVVIQDDSACLPVYKEFMVVSADFYDGKYTDATYLKVNTCEVAGTSQTAADVGANTAAILLDTGTDGVIVATNNDKTGYALSAAGVDDIHDEVTEGTTTFRQAVRLFMSVLTGKSSGGGTATLVFRDIGDTKNRLSVTVDSNGNRTAVGTRDGS